MTPSSSIRHLTPRPRPSDNKTDGAWIAEVDISGVEIGASGCACHGIANIGLNVAGIILETAVDRFADHVIPSSDFTFDATNDAPVGDGRPTAVSRIIGYGIAGVGPRDIGMRPAIGPAPSAHQAHLTPSALGRPCQ